MQIRIKLLVIFIFLFLKSLSQENTYIYGSFESNSQYLQDDEGLNFYSPSDNFRSNNYLKVDFQNGNFSYGIQYESYLPSALLGYSEIFDNKCFDDSCCATCCIISSISTMLTIGIS